MKTWTLATALALVIACSNALPIPEESPAVSAKSSSAEDTKASSVFEEMMQGAESQSKAVRSISTEPKYAPMTDELPSMERITKALEEVSQTLGAGFKNLGNSAIQILEGVDVAAEQALGTGARIVTGIAETAAETAETGARKAIRIANGVANTLTQGTKSIVDTKTTLLKGLTGASSIQADASSTNEAVQRNERGSASSGFSGYPSSPSYGPNTVSETPNNFINVFSQAAANTVNFGTQLLNSLVGVAANILQGTVSTLLSLLNAKGQIVGAVVQSAPPVLASVTRTAGDVLAAKARIFGAVTQSAVNFASQLAQTVTNTFAGLFNGPNAINFNALTGAGRSGGGDGPAAVLGGIGNFASTAVSTKLNLLNGLLSPFTGGRPLLNFGGLGGGGSSNPLAALFSPQSRGGSSGSSGGYQSPSEPNFRITIAASTPASSSVPSSTDGNGPQRPVRFFQPTTKSPRSDDLNPGNFLANIGRGLFGGMFDQLGASPVSRNPNPTSVSNVNSFLAQILPNQAKPQPKSTGEADAAMQQINSLLALLLPNARVTNQ